VDNSSVVNDIRMKTTLITSLLLIAISAVGCSSDVKSPQVASATTSGLGTNSGDGGSSTPAGPVSNGFYSLNLSNSNVSLTEGSTVSINVQIARSAGHSRLINLAVEGQTPADVTDLQWQFSDTQISDSEQSANITFRTDIGPLPIQRQVRNVRILGTDGNSQTVVGVLRLEIAPTDRPDVYLLVGQSNMVGFSETGAKQALPGELDAPNPRIQQLNVTGNDIANFPTTASFENVNAIAVSGQRLTDAVDPLHDGYDSRISGKAGTHIGMGMSFAKRAISDTQSNIVLVPAAWSNTGFCKRERTNYPGQLGWNARPSNNPVLSGTLLHDRAIARADLALQETNGILRGILWHQGEADSDNAECARLYQENISALVASLRTNIMQDARGAGARGPNANIPFVLGTMSKGAPYNFQPDPKQVVDGVHRNIKSIVPFSAYVDNDDLVPNAYPCGEGDCIHFGSTSYREMGSRYYDFLRQAAQP